MTIELERRGILFVVSSPSGGGKTTVIQKVLSHDDNLDYSVSATSRPPRPGEEDGKHYRFVTEKAFKKMIEDNRFYEWAWVHDNLYGTLKDVIIEKLGKGRDVIMDLDFQGGLNIKRQSPEAVLIFLLPPTMDDLEQRLRSRNQDSDAIIRTRLKNSVEEMAYATKYDYMIINNNVDQTVRQVETVLRAERMRSCRTKLGFNNEPALEEIMTRLEEEAEGQE